MNLQNTAGWVAGFLSAVSCIPYIEGIIKEKVKPNPATWVVLTTFNLLVLGILHSGGIHRNSLIFPTSYVVGSGSILLCSLLYGAFAWTRRDVWFIGATVLVAIYWQLSGMALMALVPSLTINLLGIYPTIVKAFRHPETESRLTWTLCFAGSAINLICIKELTPMGVIYPVYMLITCGLLAYAVSGWRARRLPGKERNDVP